MLAGGRDIGYARWLGAGRIAFSYTGTPAVGSTLVWRFLNGDAIVEARLPVSEGQQPWTVTFPDHFSGPRQLAPTSDGSPATYQIEWLMLTHVDPDEGRRELGLTVLTVTRPLQE